MNANSERLLQQRITVRMVPVTKALGSYNSNTFDFWVYGDDRRCYAPNYPAQCCCGCSVYSGVCWKWVCCDMKVGECGSLGRKGGDDGDEGCIVERAGGVHR